MFGIIAISQPSEISFGRKIKGITKLFLLLIDTGTKQANKAKTILGKK